MVLPHWLKGLTPIPDYRLTEIQRTHLELAWRIARDYPKVKNVQAAVLVHADDRVVLAGIYIADTREFFISPERLESARTTVDTTIHELGHHVSRADDGTSKHDESMREVADQVRGRAAHGAYDQALARAIW